MSRPYIICHMVVSLDGKVTGKFLFRPECAAATEVYYELNRKLKSNGFICGRVTMEESFTGGCYPDISVYAPQEKTDFIPESLSRFYAVAFDTRGRLGWTADKISDPDGDPGYDGAQIIEVLSQNVDPRYLGYLKENGIAYIFAGEEKIDVNLALEKLKTLFGAETLLLEGGSIINGAFLRADAVDELSLVTAPLTAEKDDKPLFYDSEVYPFTLISAETQNGVLTQRLKRR